MMKSSMNRRNLLRSAILGGLGYGALSALQQYGLKNGLAQWYAQMRAQNPWLEGMDALAVLEDALRGGPSLIFVSEAMAQGLPKVAFLDVFMATSFDPRNYLNLSNMGNGNNPLQTLTFGSMNSSVTDFIKTHDNFKQAKVNQFFGDLVLTGKYKMNGSPTVINGFAPLISANGLPPNKISMTSFVSYQGTGVHQRGQIPGAGSVAHMIQASGALSPIGVAAFGAVQVVDGSGSIVSGGKSSGAFISSLDQLIKEGYVPKVNDVKDSSAKNRIRIFDELNGHEDAKKVRDQWLGSLERIRSEVGALKTDTYNRLGTNMFNAFGNINADRAASMTVAGKLASSGLCTVASVGIGTPDFHRSDANRAPAGDEGNMVTAIVEAGIGIHVWAKSLIDAKMDGVAFIRTCSGRSADWVNDSSTVSSLAIIVKGSDAGPLHSIQSEYYGPMQVNNFVDDGTKPWAGGTFGLDAGNQMAGSIDGAIAETVLAAAGQSLKMRPQSKIGKFKRG